MNRFAHSKFRSASLAWQALPEEVNRSQSSHPGRTKGQLNDENQDDNHVEHLVHLPASRAQGRFNSCSLEQLEESPIQRLDKRFFDKKNSEGKVKFRDRQKERGLGVLGSLENLAKQDVATSASSRSLHTKRQQRAPEKSRETTLIPFKPSVLLQSDGVGKKGRQVHSKTKPPRKHVRRANDSFQASPAAEQLNKKQHEQKISTHPIQLRHPSTLPNLALESSTPPGMSAILGKVNQKHVRRKPNASVGLAQLFDNSEEDSTDSVQDAKTLRLPILSSQSNQCRNRRAELPTQEATSKKAVAAAAAAEVSRAARAARHQKPKDPTEANRKSSTAATRCRIVKESHIISKEDNADKPSDRTLQIKKAVATAAAEVARAARAARRQQLKAEMNTESSRALASLQSTREVRPVRKSIKTGELAPFEGVRVAACNDTNLGVGHDNFSKIEAIATTDGNLETGNDSSHKGLVPENNIPPAIKTSKRNASKYIAPAARSSPAPNDETKRKNERATPSKLSNIPLAVPEAIAIPVASAKTFSPCFSEITMCSSLKASFPAAASTEKEQIIMDVDSPTSMEALLSFNDYDEEAEEHEDGLVPSQDNWSGSLQPSEKIAVKMGAEKLPTTLDADAPYLDPDPCGMEKKHVVEGNEAATVNKNKETVAPSSDAVHRVADANQALLVESLFALIKEKCLEEVLLSLKHGQSAIPSNAPARKENKVESIELGQQEKVDHSIRQGSDIYLSEQSSKDTSTLQPLTVSLQCRDQRVSVRTSIDGKENAPCVCEPRGEAKQTTEVLSVEKAENVVVVVRRKSAQGNSRQQQRRKRMPPTAAKPDNNEKSRSSKFHQRTEVVEGNEASFPDAARRLDSHPSKISHERTLKLPMDSKGEGCQSPQNVRRSGRIRVQPDRFAPIHPDPDSVAEAGVSRSSVNAIQSDQLLEHGPVGDAIGDSHLFPEKRKGQGKRDGFERISETIFPGKLKNSTQECHLKAGSRSKTSNPSQLPGFRNSDTANEYIVGKKLASERTDDSPDNFQPPKSKPPVNVRFMNAQRQVEVDVNANKSIPSCDVWSSQQLSQLRAAHGIMNPTDPNFWSEVALFVDGKSAASCQSKWFSLVKTPNSKGGKKQISKKSNKTEIRMEEDDIFDSTPIRDYSSESKREASVDAKKVEELNLGSPIFPLMNELIARPGQKTYIQRIRREMRDGNKSKPKKKLASHRWKGQCGIKESVIEGDVALTAELSPGCTFKMNVKTDDEDDFWDELETQNEEE